VGARATGGLFFTVARLVEAAALAIFLLIALAIVLYDLKANPANSVVKGIHNGANFFASPFNGLFSIHGLRKSLTVNWGIAAVAYLIAGAIIASILATPAQALRPWRRY
jgi:hypothetical protein